MFPALARIADQLVLRVEGWGAASSRRLTMPPRHLMGPRGEGGGLCLQKSCII